MTKAAARGALNALLAQSAHRNGLNPTDVAFAEVASQLGVTPARLQQALVTLKTSG